MPKKKVHSKLYKFLIDTLAMLFFTTATGMIVELGIAKLTLTQSLASRVMWILPNLLTGGAYAGYMDWWREKLLAKSFLKSAFSDIVAFLTFQTPIYILILLLAGANLNQLLKATTSITIMAPILGVTAGWFVVWIRKMFEV
ncbi:L-alanine exporter AlaE [archaeon]|nr:L-alanine exporter AlaE [archaeon]